MIDERAAQVCEEIARPSEGFSAHPYKCPADVWTIGRGATSYLDGRPVKPTDPPISESAADRLMGVAIRTVYLPGTLAAVPTLATDSGALGAISDFSFNLGLTRLRQSTLRKRLLAGDWEGARVELSKWVRGGGRILLGLVLRRRLEAARLPYGV